MILIIAEESDLSSNIIEDWLKCWGEKFIRIDNSTIVKLDFIEILNHTFQYMIEINGEKISLKDFKACFIRRGNLTFNLQKPVSKDLNINNYIDYHLNNDCQDLYDYFYFMIRKTIPCIGNPQLYRLNKLRVLYEATQCGLKIPDSIVTCSLDYLKETDSLISKGISESIDIESTNSSFGYTCYVNKHQVTETNEFWPTLFQKEIIKAFELRVFFLINDFFSTAIFSQYNEKTKTDFRHSSETIMPMLPFKLPLSLKRKLSRLMKRLNINIGCIDILVSTKGEFYFLEINPMGQFGAYGDAVNYYLEKKIAMKLADGRF